MKQKQTPAVPHLQEFENLLFGYPERLQEDARAVMRAFLPAIQREFTTGQFRDSCEFTRSLAKALLTIAEDCPRFKNDDYLADVGGLIMPFREYCLARKNAG